jgi:hypothetical protein
MTQSTTWMDERFGPPGEALEITSSGSLDNVTTLYRGLRVNAVAFTENPDVSGFIGGVEGRVLRVIGPCVLKHETDSAPVNRITTPGEADVTVLTGTFVELVYHDSRWRCSGASGGGGGAGTPGGSNTQVQFNDSSAFGGDSGLTYNKTSNVLTAAGGIATGADPSTWNNGIDLSHNQSIASRNSTDDDDVTLLGLIADTVTIGDPGYDIVLQAGTGRDLVLRSDTTKFESGSGANGGVLEIPEAGAEPGAPADGAFVYVDPADSLLKYKQADSTVRTPVTPFGAVADGDVLMWDATAEEWVPVETIEVPPGGTAGQALRLDAGGTAWEWYTPGGGGGGAFDPATMALTAWWRGSYSASPWVGTASAGNSGSEDLTEGTNPPSPGSTVDGYAPASFDGSNDLLANAGPMSGFIGGAWGVWIMFKSGTAFADQGAGSRNLNTQFLASDAGVWNIGFSTAGIHVQVTEGGTGTIKDPGPIACGVGAWHVLFCWYDGTDISLQLDEGAPSTVACAAMHAALAASALNVGIRFNSTLTIDAQVMEIGMIDSAFSGTDTTDIYAYLQDRYPAASLP